MSKPQSVSGMGRGVAVAVLLAAVVAVSACRRIGRLILSPFRKSEETAPAQPRKSFFHLPSFGANPVIRQSILAYGGEAAWERREGIELEMVWKTFDGTRIVEDPALVQMATGYPPQIRIYFSKLDQVFALGDKGPWVMMEGKPDDSPDFITRAHYTAATMAFFLSLPFSLADPGVVVRGQETRTWGGDTFDVLTVGFTGGSYPWISDSMTLWFRRPSYWIDRCYFVSTAPGSAFGPPPNQVWILWQQPAQLGGMQLARVWSFHRSDENGAVKEKLFDVEVAKAAGNRSFLPVLFRRPRIEPLTTTRPPAVNIPTKTPTPTPPAKPTPTGPVFR